MRLRRGESSHLGRVIFAFFFAVFDRENAWVFSEKNGQRHGHFEHCGNRQVERWRSELAAIGETGFQRYLKEASSRILGILDQMSRILDQNWNILLMKVS